MVKKRYVALLSVVTMIGGMTIGVGAAPVIEKITASLNWGIRYEVNGQEWTPKDANGKKLAAITYNNTNYLPVKAVSEALGAAVEFDSKEQKIMIGEKSDTTPITKEEIKAGAFSFITKDKQYTVYNGKDYGPGVVMEDINSAEKSFILKPNGKHQTFQIDVIPVSVTDEISVKVYNGEMVLKEIAISPNSGSQHIDLDIEGAKEIEISAQRENAGGNDTIFIGGTYK